MDIYLCHDIYIIHNIYDSVLLSRDLTDIVRG